MTNHKISLMDCTLRDGGYINNWEFGEHAIIGITKKMAQTGIEAIELGFIKPQPDDKGRTVFSGTTEVKRALPEKDSRMLYVGMLDMSSPVPMEKITPREADGIDALRVIFKKNKIQEGIDYCIDARKKGYLVFVQPVGSDLYSDEEFIRMIQRFNTVKPDALYIVDSFGLIKMKHFLRLVYLADNNLDLDIALGYHSHNNLQQAFANAQALTELSLNRDIYIDACVFGMGRGAGNLHMELFAEYLNENFGKNYRIEPLLEIIDLYLNDIYRKHFWGYSLPYYLSASNSCHPNYAIYFEKKGSLTVKSFNEVLKSIPDKQKALYSPEIAESIYQNYQRNYVDDADILSRLEKEFSGKPLLILAPGKSLNKFGNALQEFIDQYHPIVISLSHYNEVFKSNYVFCTNAKRSDKIYEYSPATLILTSNIREYTGNPYLLNYASYACDMVEIAENSGIMFLNLLLTLGIKESYIAGMDGYTEAPNFFTNKLDVIYSKSEKDVRNFLIKNQLDVISKRLTLHFLTPSVYCSNVVEGGTCQQRL
ncbi:MAG: aldolase catalytic domain-containing protein [Candidatus Cloacimonadaceae bacterium]